MGNHKKEFSYHGNIEDKFMFYFDCEIKTMYKSSYVDIDINGISDSEDNFLPIELQYTPYINIYGYIEGIDENNIRNYEFKLITNDYYQDKEPIKICDLVIEDNGFFSLAASSSLNPRSLDIVVN